MYGERYIAFDVFFYFLCPSFIYTQTQSKPTQAILRPADEGKLVIFVLLGMHAGPLRAQVHVRVLLVLRP